MRYEEKYNRHIADSMFEWHSDEWIVNRHGNLVLRQELIEDSEQYSTIFPEYYDKEVSI